MLAVVAVAASLPMAAEPWERAECMFFNRYLNCTWLDSAGWPQRDGQTGKVRVVHRPLAQRRKRVRPLDQTPKTLGP